MGQPDKKLRSRTCANERDALAFITGQVATANRDLLEEHIVQCEDCRKQIASLTRLILSEESADESRLIEIIRERTETAALSSWQDHRDQPTSPTPTKTRRGNGRSRLNTKAS
jgi:hypothetical protein